MLISFGIMLVIVCLIFLGWTDYKRFLKDRKTVYEGFSTVNTSYGEIEYLDLGPKDAPVVLYSTGGGAGIDSALAFDWLIQNGYRVLSINRPGYSKLSVNVVDSIKGHAKIYHEVIVSLGIREVNVFGVSMGGLSSLYFAQMYPVKSMVLWSAVSGEYHPNQEAVDSPLGKLVMGNKGKSIISWMLVRFAEVFPKATIRNFLKTEAYLDKNETKQIVNSIVYDEDEKRRFVQFVKSLTPMNKLYDGMMDEVAKSASPQHIEWEKIKMPVLAIYSSWDKDLEPNHFERLQKNLVRGKFMTVKAGGHFVWWGTDGKEVINETVSFYDKINK
ncbi:alpha/beta fold hydrolase [Bacillus sp. AK031]